MSVVSAGVKRQRLGAGAPRLAAIGASGPREYPLVKRKTVLGSASGKDIVIPEPSVSRSHALFKRRFGRFTVIDLESTNGTFLNGRRIRGPTRVERGDELRFGAARFVFLKPRKTSELRRRIRPVTALSLLALLGTLGFAGALHFINRALFERLDLLSRGESEARAKLNEQRALAEQPLWLRRVNYYRAMVKLPAAKEGPALDRGAFLHARYLVKYRLRTNTNAFGHSEDPNDPYYTPQGLSAAQNSDVAGPANLQQSGVQEIDGWITGPFHRLRVLASDAKEMGFGAYTEGGWQASVLYLPLPPMAPHTRKKPVIFPPKDSATPLAVYGGWEWPNPLASCPGYVAPTGLAITLRLGAWMPVAATGSSFSRNGLPLEHCVFDAETYENLDPATQNWGRNVLKGSSAVILIPRLPLTSGERYTASITTNGQSYTWSFTVAE